MRLRSLPFGLKVAAIYGPCLGVIYGGYFWFSLHDWGAAVKVGVATTFIAVAVTVVVSQVFDLSPAARRESRDRTEPDTRDPQKSNDDLSQLH
ncbi:MAG TPA: hypothetical protein VF808_10995 [Ktedonobacterales bacterium]